MKKAIVVVLVLIGALIPTGSAGATCFGDSDYNPNKPFQTYCPPIPTTTVKTTTTTLPTGTTIPLSVTTASLPVVTTTVAPVVSPPASAVNPPDIKFAG